LLQALQAEFDAHLATLQAGSLANALAHPARRGRTIVLGKSS